MREVEYVPDWLLNKLCSESDENLCKISDVLWEVWFARNKRIFENKICLQKSL